MFTRLTVSQILILAAALFLCWASTTAPQVAAQENAPAAAGDQNPAKAGEASAAPKPGTNRFVWFLYTSGFIGFVILLISIYFIATVVRLFMELRMTVSAPPEEIAACE